MSSAGNMIYQEGYFPPPPPPAGGSPQPDARRRSSSYTDRYRPRNYSNPPPGQADPALLGPYQQPQAQLAPHQVPLPMSNPASPWQQPPYPTGEQALMPRADIPAVPQRQLADELPPRSAVMYPDGLRRASHDADAQTRRYSHDGRRPSYDADAQMRRSSHDGRRSSYDADAQLRRSSHDSRRSNRSHHSHRPRYEDDGQLEDDDEEYERRHSHHDHDHEHRHHHHHDAEESSVDELEKYRQKRKDRGDNVSRSFGDSLVSVFGQPLKWLIEPRDKY